MHIPDGYLSPQTNILLSFASALTAAGAAYKTARTFRAKHIPLISIGAAFSFTLMMFNIPIPDGTTAHAVGGTLLTVLLGPWAAMIGISVALAIQALFFGDGGILALGANIFNIAIVLPFISYFVYQIIAGRSSVTSKRRPIAAAIAGYIGLSVAALATGIEFGLQPLLFHAPDGTPLYSPYGLNVAVPAMLFAHLTIAGTVEGIISALVLSYLQKTNPSMLELRNNTSSSKMPLRRLVMGVLILVVLSPIGLLASGTAWGEWSSEEIGNSIGYIPAGMQKFSDFWQHSLLRDYEITGYGDAFWQQTLGYLISALIGLTIIGILAFVFQRFFQKNANKVEIPERES